MPTLHDADAISMLVAAIERIPGIESVEGQSVAAEDLTIDDLHLPLYGFMPHLLLRQEGSIGTVLQVSFEIERNERGLRGLEFLAWFIADLSRAGASVQLRSVALPAEVGAQSQLGHTLRFMVDALLPREFQTEVSRWAESLQLAARLYRSALFPSGGVTPTGG